MDKTVTVIVEAEIHMSATLHDDGTVTLHDARATAKANDPSYVMRHPREGIELDDDGDSISAREADTIRDYVMTNEWPAQLTLFA